LRGVAPTGAGGAGTGGSHGTSCSGAAEAETDDGESDAATGE
jgi:hypothetical protein